MTRIQVPMKIEFENRTTKDNACSEGFKFDIADSDVLSSISFQYSRMANHGAPCSISMSGHDGKKDHAANDREFHRFVRKVHTLVSTLDDKIPYLESEGKMGDFRSSFRVSSFDGLSRPETFRDIGSSRHTLCSGWGDEPNAGFDAIAPQNALNVFRKALQVSVDEKAIDVEQATAILSGLTEKIMDADSEIKRDQKSNFIPSA